MAEQDDETEPKRIYVKTPQDWTSLSDGQKAEFAEHVLELLKGRPDTPRSDT
jgi:hypothetical protein